ncbi:MAG: nitroreductase family protein [Bacteroidales bacterium]
MNNKILSILTERYSPVAFSDKPVDDATLQLLFEAASKAPSSYNDQPWHFFVARKDQEELYPQLFDALMEANQLWAKTAPVLMLSAAQMISPTSGKENRFAFHDTGMAMGNLLAQATHMGLFVHQMGGYSVSKARKAAALPDNMEPVAMIALGYKGDVNQLPESLHEKDQKRSDRKAIDEFVFTEPL